LSGEWQNMDYDKIVDYMSGDRTVVRETSDWHLHDPNAERHATMDFTLSHHDIETEVSETDIEL